jgi:hypothetical protein
MKPDRRRAKQWFEYVGGPGKDFPCRWDVVVECRLPKCQLARQCKDLQTAVPDDEGVK